MRLLLTSFLALSACATNYQQMPASKLCMDYLSLPSYNINQQSRLEELNRRGEDCRGYGAAAAARRDSEKSLEDSLRYIRDNY